MCFTKITYEYFEEQLANKPNVNEWFLLLEKFTYYISTGKIKGDVINQISHLLLIYKHNNLDYYYLSESGEKRYL